MNTISTILKVVYSIIKKIKNNVGTSLYLNLSNKKSKSIRVDFGKLM